MGLKKYDHKKLSIITHTHNFFKIFNIEKKNKLIKEKYKNLLKRSSIYVTLLPQHVGLI